MWLRLLPYKWFAVGALALVVALYVDTLHIRISSLRASVATVTAAFSDYRREQAHAALVASESYRKTEAEYRKRVEDSDAAYHALQADSAKRLAREIATSRAAIADNDGLRADLASFARGRDPTSDTVAAASQRAAALGLVLAEALRLEDETLLAGAESAGAAESNGDAVRALLSAWPR